MERHKYQIRNLFERLLCAGGGSNSSSPGLSCKGETEDGTPAFKTQLSELKVHIWCCLCLSPDLLQMRVHQRHVSWVCGCVPDWLLRLGSKDTAGYDVQHLDIALFKALCSIQIYTQGPRTQEHQLAIHLSELSVLVLWCSMMI